MFENIFVPSVFAVLIHLTNDKSNSEIKLTKKNVKKLDRVSMCTTCDKQRSVMKNGLLWIEQMNKWTNDNAYPLHINSAGITNFL